MSNLSEIFKAYDIRGKVGTELTPDLVKKTGQAFSDWLPKKGPVAVGRDMRPDSAKLAKALIDGVLSQGRDVIDLGQITSDMSYFAVGKYDLAGAAVVTASHNPGAYNGIKLYRDHVVAVGLDSGLDEIRDTVLSKDSIMPSPKKGNLTQKDITEDWLGHVMSFAPETMKLKPYKIAIDCGNGMAGKIIPELEPYVPWQITEMYFELDGTFPNHEANPQKPENMKDLVKVVTENGLDFGVAFDGDGDRAGFVDDKGRIVSGSDLISIVSQYYLQKHPGAEIVHEVRTSRSTKELIKKWGGRPYRTKAGRISIGKVMRERKAPFGGETTGHLFFEDNYYADSGLIAVMVAIVAIQKTGKKLSKLVDDFHKYATTPEINFEVKDKDNALKLVADKFRNGEKDELDGLSVDFDFGWFNLRKSNTEPLIRLNAEAITQQQLDDLIDKISKILKNC